MSYRHCCLAADRSLPDCPPRLQMHATCLGMEAVSVAVARENSLLETFDGTNNPSTVRLVPGGEVSKNASTMCWSVSCSSRYSRYEVRVELAGLYECFPSGMHTALRWCFILCIA